jgi:hypothetical protein
MTCYEVLNTLENQHPEWEGASNRADLKTKVESLWSQVESGLVWKHFWRLLGPCCGNNDPEFLKELICVWQKVIDELVGPGSRRQVIRCAQRLRKLELLTRGMR